MRAYPRVTVGVLSLVCLASISHSQSCYPPCRKGYICAEGECVSACNPPCPAGYFCDTVSMDCYPNQALQQNEGNVPAVKNKRGPCSTRKDCSVGYTCFDGECEKSTWVASAGNHAFGSTVFIYGAGTVYSSAISIFSSFANYRSGDYYDSYYGKEDALLMLGPQSGAFVVFGGLNQISKGKQALYLRKLGAKPASKLVGTGVLLYGLSLVTMGVHLVSYASDEPGFVRTTAFVNAAVLASSFVVNVAGYYKQAQLLQGATGVPLNRMVETSPPRVAPYAGIIRGGGAAGAVVYF